MTAMGPANDRGIRPCSSQVLVDFHLVDAMTNAKMLIPRSKKKVQIDNVRMATCTSSRPSTEIVMPSAQKTTSRMKSNLRRVLKTLAIKVIRMTALAPGRRKSTPRRL